MAGLGIRLFTDEMIHTGLAIELRWRGYDAESCQEASRSNQKIPDDAQLLYATQQGRAILSYNQRHFVPLDQQWKAAGRRHAGIILSPTIGSLGTLILYVQRHLDTYSRAEQDDLLLWLDTSPTP
jgi:Domain of unknown function (DUF5615)